MTFAGEVYQGTTDSNGFFRTEYIKGLGSGDYLADVDILMADGYDWDVGMDLEDDDTLSIP